MQSTTNRAAGACNDFDFMLGRWRSRQRRLRARLQGCTDWEVFDAQTQAQRLPGGLVHFDTLVAETWRPGWVGMTLRCFHPTTGRWSIHWLTNDGTGLDADSGRLAPPVVGGFQGDEGLFEGEDLLDGRPIRVRFTWRRQGPDRARWEQAFSADGGRSWEVNWTMDFERLADEPVLLPLPGIEPQVVELRRYRVRPGQREALIALFDSRFIEPQQAQGMVVIGQFREADAPERFIWLRGFADMASRTAALAGFYDGPEWQQHRDAANATMVDSDDVLLLRPAWPGAGLPVRRLRRAAGAVRMAPAQQVLVSLYALREPASAELLALCRTATVQAAPAGHGSVCAWYRTEAAANPYPRLPVRQDLQVLVRVASGPAAADAEPPQALEALIAPWLSGPPEHHRLVPTARSALGHAPAADDGS